MMADSLTIAVVAGLTGAPHCIIMCGGIGSSIALEARKSAMLSVLAYHAGRIVTYSVSGAVMGSIGSFINAAGKLVGLQSIASIVGGAFILLWAFRKYAIPLPARKTKGSRITHEIAGRIRAPFELLSVFLTGLMLGLLPCGLTYSMQMRAAAAGSWIEGMATLLVFGLATVPVLLAVALTANRMGRRWRRGLRAAGFYVAVIMGLLSILKGFSVNGWIPSIHPWLW
ncbi:sulfite exporter TauE/SafE family protein [Cohnella faecalis]|uniref:Sulfite exporter TauE/SafE family protein n=1 Tax=Cohnella faecalis TaxID=2315694 RepID=A0A398CQ87_9BACL|nr:sulfite exporter TauE/SafE family protein [Cohnella faecalis]RIE03469.1 sulfite exporter TauE/SafE family protein [Cohnella faecalis]